MSRNRNALVHCQQLSTERVSPRWSVLMLAASLAVAAGPAQSQAAPDCEAAACPQLSLRLDENFEVSRRRLEQGADVAVPANSEPAQRTRRVQDVHPQAPAAPPSPWRIGMLALVAGMLLQWFLQTLASRRRVRAARPDVSSPSGELIAVVEAPPGLPAESQAPLSVLQEPLPEVVLDETPPIASPEEAPEREGEPPEALPAVAATTVPVAEVEIPATMDADPVTLPELTAVDAPAQPASAGLPERPADDPAHGLETVSLLRRLSAQRARGLHPEARLSAVFRLIAAGQAKRAARALRELEAFCSEEAFPAELITTHQHIARRRGHRLQTRIDGLRERAHSEASGRRLAVAGAFLKRGRLDAVAEVLDELESDLSGECTTP